MRRVLGTLCLIAVCWLCLGVAPGQAQVSDESITVVGPRRTSPKPQGSNLSGAIASNRAALRAEAIAEVAAAKAAVKSCDYDLWSRAHDDYDMTQRGMLGIGARPIPAFPDYPWPCYPQTASAANFSAEILVFGGSTSASSFGSDYQSTSVGARAALAFTPISVARIQLDFQGSKYGSYCTACGDASYVATGAHLTGRFLPNTDLGIFGTFERAQPTFSEPASTDGLLGLEARHFFTPGFMIGGQVGRLDAIDGKGTLTRANFAEGRLKFSLGNLFGHPVFSRLGFGTTVGYASGKLRDTTIGASSSYWNTIVSYRPFAAPVSVFVDYGRFTNRVETFGAVWTEHMFKGGIKFGFGDSSIEPTLPQPVVTRTILKF